MSEAEGAGTLQYKHATRMQGERGWTVEARGKSTKYLFVHKTSLHGNEVPHNSFPKQARPRRALTELRGVEGQGGSCCVPGQVRGAQTNRGLVGKGWEKLQQLLGFQGFGLYLGLHNGRGRIEPLHVEGPTQRLHRRSWQGRASQTSPRVIWL